MSENWVSVDERLPDKMDYYICAMDVEPEMGPRIDIVFYATRAYGSMAIEKTGWAKPVLHEWANNNVRYWMPLPELPNDLKLQEQA